MINSFALVGAVIGARYIDQSFTLTEASEGVKNLKYSLNPLNTTFDNDQDIRNVVAITVIDPTGKGSDITNVQFASADTVKKGFIYLKGTDQRDIWQQMPIADLIPDNNHPYILLDYEMLGKIDWNKSFIFFGAQADIADDDIGKNLWLHILYNTIPQKVK